MTRSTFTRYFLPVLFAAIFATGTAFAQGTTSSMRVVVTNETGGAASGVDVEIRHVPTGRIVTSTSNASGMVNARGLAVGGPYEVSVATGSSVSGNTVGDVMLRLDETEVVILNVQSSILEEITVVAQKIGQDIAVGVGRNFDRAAIDATPSVSRDFVSTLARDPKILVDNSVARGPAVSLAGANFRFNSVTVDGIPQNDNFGLSKNASATQRTPISIDAIEALSVNIAPYDVSYGNFIGGNINIVTKSGTNDLEGSVFYFSTDDSLSGDKSDGASIDIGDFSEDYYGFALGGPIIRDKLFFFANYEKFETTRPANSQPIANIAGITQQDIDDSRDALQRLYGFDPGPFATSDDDQDEKILLKLDWSINDDHRAVARYQVAEGDVIFDDKPELGIHNSNRYDINEKLTSYSAELFSSWTDRFSTEIKIGFKDIENRQVSKDSSTPEFMIFSFANGGELNAGGDRFRHANELDNESQIFRLKGDYQLGDHLLTAGYERETFKVRNLFLPFSRGTFLFGLVPSDSVAGTPSDLVPFDVVLYGNQNNGQNAEVNFELAIDSFYIQDEWTPNSDLTIMAGVRFDSYSNDDVVPLNTAYTARNGFSNQENLDGKDLVLPRFGVNWTPTDRLTLRGGAGMFGGGQPLIILSNSYAGNGVTRTFIIPFEGTGGEDPVIDQAISDAYAALPSPTAAVDALQQFINAPAPGQPNLSAVEAINPNFEILSTWKYSLGAEYVFGDDWIVNADIVISEAKDAYNAYEGRRVVVGTAPDGRDIYNFPADGDYIVTNTNEGSGTVISASLSKAWDTDFGYFDFDIGYTNQDVDELRSYNRFITYETYSFDAQASLNSPQVAPSKYEVEHRVTANLIWQKELFGDNATTIGLNWAGRSGRHYSYVFGSTGTAFGGTFLADFGSEGETPGVHLFYVPTGTADPLISPLTDQAFLQDLDTFISSEGCLNGARGSIINRNACETDWVNIISLRFQQEIKIGQTALDLFLDIENLGNLINSDWGRVDSYTAPSNVAPAEVTIDAATNQYVLTPFLSYAGTPETIVPRPTIASIPSVYRIQFGLRFRF